LTLRVHPPRRAPVRDYHWIDYATGEDHNVSTRKWAEVSSTGEIEFVAQPTGVMQRIRSLDLNRAHHLSKLTAFWRRRQDALARAAAKVRALAAL
jgi:hypothetical protein